MPERQPYAVVTADFKAESATVLRLWSASFQSLRGDTARRKLEQAYLANPAGKGLLFLLRDCRTDTPVGVQCLVPRRFLNRGVPLAAGIMADYAVDPAHRSLGPALQLLRHCVAGARAELAFTYGLPNRKSEAIFRRAGLEPVTTLARFAALLRSRAVLARHLPQWLPGVLLTLAAGMGDLLLRTIDWLRERRSGGRLIWRHFAGCEADLEADIDAIWASAHPGLALSERSAKMVCWRFGPLLSQTGGWQISVARPRAAAAPLGYVVWARRNGTAVIADFLCRDPAAQTAHLLAAFRRLAREQGADTVSVEFTGSTAVARELERAGYWRREGSPLYCLGQEALPPVDSWYFTSFDRDND